MGTSYSGALVLIGLEWGPDSACGYLRRVEWRVMIEEGEWGRDRRVETGGEGEGWRGGRSSLGGLALDD